MRELEIIRREQVDIRWKNRSKMVQIIISQILHHPSKLIKRKKRKLKKGRKVLYLLLIWNHPKEQIRRVLIFKVKTITNRNNNLKQHLTLYQELNLLNIVSPSKIMISSSKKVKLIDLLKLNQFSNLKMNQKLSHSTKIY